MITLYHSLSARSFRPLWLLEELASDYKLFVLPFPPRVKRREFLELNPLGTVPLLVHGDVRMSESSAMCQYLVSLSPGSSVEVTPRELDYASYLNYLHQGEATLTFPLTLVLRYSRFEEPRRLNPQVSEDYTRWFLARLRTLQPHLEHSDYLCSGRFTIADISVGYALMLAQHLGLGSKFPPAVATYWSRLQARSGFKRALSAQHLGAIEQGVCLTPAPDLTYEDILAV